MALNVIDGTKASLPFKKKKSFKVPGLVVTIGVTYILWADDSWTEFPVICLMFMTLQFH